MIDVVRFLDLQGEKCYAQYRCGGLNLPHLEWVRGVYRIQEDGHVGHGTTHFLDAFHSLLTQGDVDAAQSRDVATRPREASDEPGPARIGSIPDHDGDDIGRILGSIGRDRAFYNEAL